MPLVFLEIPHLETNSVSLKKNCSIFRKTYPKDPSLLQNEYNDLLVYPPVCKPVNRTQFSWPGICQQLAEQWQDPQSWRPGRPWTRHGNHQRPYLGSQPVSFMAIYLLSSLMESLSLLLPSKDWRRNRKTLGDRGRGNSAAPYSSRWELQGRQACIWPNGRDSTRVRTKSNMLLNWNARMSHRTFF